MASFNVGFYDGRSAPKKEQMQDVDVYLIRYVLKRILPVCDGGKTMDVSFSIKTENLKDMMLGEVTHVMVPINDAL